jgi:predicted Fe-Mo cluster-binding NifX family protein
MKIAIPIWNDRVSSAFDFAHKLLLVDIECGHETGREEISLLPESIPEKANRLKTLGVKVLICGAISRSLASQVKASGVKVLPYVVGQVDEILEAYLTDKLVQPQFVLPGSWPGARRGFRRRRRSHRSGKLNAKSPY